MTMREMIQRYLNEMAITGKAAGTITYHRIYLEQFTAFLRQHRVNSVNDITVDSITKYHIHLFKQHLSTLTIHSKLSVLSCFFSFLYNNDILLYNYANDIRFPKRILTISQRILTEAEMNRLLSLPLVNTRKGLRDRALMEVLYSTAIRCSELTGLDLYDVNRDNQMIRVLGKGKKERVVPLGRVALDWLDRYVKTVRRTIRACHRQTNDRALFLDIELGTRLSKNTVALIVREYAQQSGIRKRITPHTFRHTCATHLLKNGCDLRYIQQLLGHKSIDTTQIYTRVAITDLADVYMNTHPRAQK